MNAVYLLPCLSLPLSFLLSHELLTKPSMTHELILFIGLGIETDSLLTDFIKRRILVKMVIFFNLNKKFAAAHLIGRRTGVAHFFLMDCTKIL